LLTDKYTWDRFIFTGKFVIMAVVLQFFVGVGSAYLLQENGLSRSGAATISPSGLYLWASSGPLSS
jgi:ABC-type sugar transport system permease subunit